MSGSFMHGVRVRYDTDMSESEAVDFYRVLSDEVPELLATGLTSFRPETRQDHASRAVSRWQEQLDRLSAHLGNSVSADTAGFLAREQARINEAWEIVPTL